MNTDMRRNVIISAALRVAAARGIAHVTFRSTAEACEVETSWGTVKHYMKTIPDLQRAVMARAAVEGNRDIVQSCERLGLVVPTS